MDIVKFMLHVDTRNRGYLTIIYYPVNQAAAKFAEQKNEVNGQLHK